MGLFGKLLSGSGSKKEEKILPWQQLNDVNQLSEIEGASFKRPQLIFKHSTRCGISRMVMNQFVSSYDITQEEADLYYLDLLNYRDLSAETGFKFQVVHQSPQLIVIKNGETVAHGSHSGVNNINLEKYL